MTQAPSAVTNAEYVLSLINSLSETVSGGAPASLLAFSWVSVAHATEGWNTALNSAVEAGYVECAGPQVRVTRAGYAALCEAEPPLLEYDAMHAAAYGGPPTEYALRNRVLALFESTEGETLTAAEADQRWRAMQFRAGDLRDSLDLLLRDRHAKMRRLGGTRFKLADDGVRYRQGRSADDVLQADAPMLDPENLGAPGANDQALMVLSIYTFDRNPDRPASVDEIDYRLERYTLPKHLRHLAIELLHRHGYIDPVADGVQYVLTPDGESFLSKVRANSKLQTMATAVLKPVITGAAE